MRSIRCHGLQWKDALNFDCFDILVMSVGRRKSLSEGRRVVYHSVNVLS
jgi:hypothetical protein